MEEYIDDVPDNIYSICAAADTGSGSEAQGGGASIFTVVCS